jgi:hypothetical protein
MCQEMPYDHPQLILPRERIEAFTASRKVVRLEIAMSVASRFGRSMRL